MGELEQAAEAGPAVTQAEAAPAAYTCCDDGPCAMTAPVEVVWFQPQDALRIALIVQLPEPAPISSPHRVFAMSQAIPWGHKHPHVVYDGPTTFPDYLPYVRDALMAHVHELATTLEMYRSSESEPDGIPQTDRPDLVLGDINAYHPKTACCGRSMAGVRYVARRGVVECQGCGQAYGPVVDPAMAEVARDPEEWLDHGHSEWVERGSPIPDEAGARTDEQDPATG